MTEFEVWSTTIRREKFYVTAESPGEASSIVIVPKAAPEPVRVEEQQVIDSVRERFPDGSP